MFKLHRKMEYGLMALRHISQQSPEKLISAKDICQIYGVSFNAMAKVLQQLSQAGWLRVVQGKKGGYQIQKNLQQSSFLDLTEILVGPVHLVDCLTSEDHDCSLVSCCNVVSPMKRLNERVKEFYHEIKISDLLEDHKNDLLKQDSFCV